MNGRVAKRIRREVYGSGKHPGSVTYTWGTPVAAKQSRKEWVRKALKKGMGICILSDTLRLRYKQAKKAYKRC